MENQSTKLYDKYLYRPGILMPVLAIVMFGGCTALFVYLAGVAKTVPVNFMGFLDLQPPWGQIPFWILSFLGLGFVFMGFVGLYIRFFWPLAYLEITEYSIKVPRLFFKKEREIFFGDVTAIEEFDASGTRTIKLKTAKDSAVITNRLLESDKIYETVRDSIYKQIPLEIYDSGVL